MPDAVDRFRELLHRIQEGSEDAARELVRIYGSALRRAVRRSLDARLRPKFDSLDFVQIVWASFFRERDQADRFDRPEDLVSYLTAVAHNKVGMEVRRRLRAEKYNVTKEMSLESPLIDDEDLPQDRPAPPDVAIARERWDSMLVGQPEHLRQIIQMRLQGYTCRAIAARLQLSDSTVRRFLRRLSCEKVA